MNEAQPKTNRTWPRWAVVITFAGLVGFSIWVVSRGLHGHNVLHAAGVDAWKDYLAAAGESSLSATADRRAYRLVYRPSWRAPVVMVAEADRDGGALAIKVLDGQGAVRPGKLARQYSRRLTSLEWESLSGVLKAGFWAQQSEQEPDLQTHDGSGCMIEGVRWGEYHRVAGWNPTSNAFRVACRALLDLTAEDVPVTEFQELVHD